MHRSLVLAGLCIACSAGCASLEAERDHDKMRTALLDLYTNQIMDNLIRAKNGMPIIQIDYTNVSANVTVKETSGISDGVTTTDINAATRSAAPALMATATTMNALTAALGFDHTNQIGLVATPVTTSDAVYDAYNEFLGNGGLRVSCGPPPKGAAHLCRRCGAAYYWVPIEYQREFLRLALVTTAQRAPLASPLDAFYSVNIVQVLSMQTNPPLPPNPDPEVIDPLTPSPPTPTTPTKVTKSSRWLYVKIDKKIPIDEGYMDVSSGTGSAKPTSTTPAAAGQSAAPDASADQQSDQNSPASKSSPPGAQKASKGGVLFIFDPKRLQQQKGRSNTTDELRIYFDDANPPANFNDVNAFINSINVQPLAAKVILDSHRPAAKSESASLAEFYLQQIQQGQFRNNGP